MNIDQARDDWRAAYDRLERCAQRIEALPKNAPVSETKALADEMDRLEDACSRAHEAYVSAARIAQVRTLQVPPETSSTRARVSSEPLTYEKDGPYSYFRDLYAATRTGDMAARSRLERHQREIQVERRDLSSTDGAGGDFVAPLWMMDEWIPAVRAGRPFANVVRQLPLPPNTDTVSIPKVLTGAATSAQADLGAVQETDPTTGAVSIPVKTVAGQVDVSQQIFDRGLPGMDVVLFADLVADYAVRLDLQCLTGSGSGANAKGVLSDANRLQVTYTDASPTVAEFYSKVADAAQQLFGQIFRPATHIVMHPRRWGWLSAAADTTGRPLMSPVASQNSPGEFAVTAEGVVGTLQGLTVVIDANLPTNQGAGTNEDVVIVTRAQEDFLFELPEGPVTRAHEQVLDANLAVRLQAYGYFAFSSERLSKANATISGTGLVAPTF